MKAIMPSANEVCEWLKKASVRPIIDCRPVKVTIKKHSYVGAFYSTERPYIATERAVTEGRVSVGEKYVEHKFYLIGVRPKMRRVHHCFQWSSEIPLDERVERHTDEWYVSCYSSDDPKFKIRWKMFMLSEWCSHAYGYYENHKIDTLVRFKYERAPMTVEVLT